MKKKCKKNGRWPSRKMKSWYISNNNIVLQPLQHTLWPWWWLGLSFWKYNWTTFLLPSFPRHFRQLLQQFSPLTEECAWTPFAMLQKVSPYSKGFLSLRKLLTSCVSSQSRLVLAAPISACCSPLLLFVFDTSCNDSCTAAQMGIDSVQMFLCCSSIPLPCVNPPLVFTFRIKHCSITWSVGSEGQGEIVKWG